MHRITIKLTIVGTLSALALLLCSTAFTTQSAVREAVASPRNLARIPAGALLYVVGRRQVRRCGAPIIRPIVTLMLAHEKMWIQLKIPAEMTGYSHIPAAIYQWKIPKEGENYNWEEAARTLDLVRDKLAKIDSLSGSQSVLAQHQKLIIAAEDEVIYGEMVLAIQLAVASEFVDFDFLETSKTGPVFFKIGEFVDFDYDFDTLDPEVFDPFDDYRRLVLSQSFQE